MTELYTLLHLYQFHLFTYYTYTYLPHSLSCVVFTPFSYYTYTYLPHSLITLIRIYPILSITPFSQFCLTNLLGFCLNITHIALKASIVRDCPQTEVTLMCTGHFLMIRYKPPVILCALPSPIHCCA